MGDFFSAMLPIFLNAMLPIFGTFATAATGVLAVKANAWVKEKTQNEMAENAMRRITHTAETVVDELNQTLVPKVLAAASDGKLTADDAHMLKNEAVGMVRDRLPLAVMAASKFAANNVATLIGAKIEQAVGKAKADGKAPVKG